MNDREQAERQIREIIERLYADYEKAAKPYFDLLYTLRGLNQPALIVTADQAKGLGFEIVEETRLTAAEIGKAMEG